MAEPQHNKGRSKQDYRTPPEFLAAVKNLLGTSAFYIDLAASHDNAVCPRYLNEGTNALVHSWDFPYKGLWGWCNPPFSHIEPWVKKAYTEQAQVAMLLPAGVGSNWFRDWVHRKAYVLFLNGRLTFVGQPTCYPKDCILILWSEPPGYDVWSWTK